MSDIYVPTTSHPGIPFARQAKVGKVLATTDPEQISVTRRFYKAATFSAVKGAPNTPNTDDLYLGFDGTDTDVKVSAGSSISISSGVDGWPNDLSRIWIKGSVGDGVLVNFQEGVDV